MRLLNSQEINELLTQVGPGALVYLVGAGGCGMSGLAHLLLDQGFKVAGSDLQINQEIHALRQRGATIHQGHTSAQLESACPLLVVYTSAVNTSNPELQCACRLGVPVARRAVVLAALLARQRGICVAGMHGKTTTCALLAYALEKLGARPSYAVGWSVSQLERQARFSAASAERAAPFFVAEADESDGTLREFHPQYSIILNLDEEHLDYFSDFEAISREFSGFAGQTAQKVVFCADDARLALLMAHHPHALSYGYHPLAAYRIENKHCGSSPGQPNGGCRLPSPPQACFEIWHDRRRLGEFSLLLAGEKNISNAGAVIAILHQLGYLPAEIAEAIRDFRGADRRQQELFRDERCVILDDYGHHPNEIRATLRAMKSLNARRILVVFQPHRFTRTRDLLREFGRCFAGVDRLWLMDIYPASEAPIPGVDAHMLAREISAQGQPVEVAGNLRQLGDAVRAAIEPGDLVLFLGAGADVTVVAHALADRLRQEPPTEAEKILASLGACVSSKTALRRNEPLNRRTTLRVGGPADFYVEPESEPELSAVLKFCEARKMKFFLLGRGSNLLVRDGGFRGVVISLAHKYFTAVEVINDRIVCGAGAYLKAVVAEARKSGLGGLEFLEGIPGSVGGALRMNAGAMGNWLFDVVETVRCMDYEGRLFERRASELIVEYRGCPLFKNHVALSATLKGRPASAAEIEEKLRVSSERRWDSQPKQPSAGCIFKNPKVIPAGKLIDELELKGTRVGGAVVSDVHANFIVNDGGASARDVLDLIAIVRERVRQERGIDLETEVEILGEEASR